MSDDSDTPVVQVYDPWVARAETVYNIAASIHTIKDSQARKRAIAALDILLQSLADQLKPRPVLAVSDNVVPININRKDD